MSREPARTYVAIASVGLSEHLTELVTELSRPGGADAVTVWCNGDLEDLRRTAGLLPPQGRPARLRWEEGLGIYSVWNRAMDEAAAGGFDVCAVLNDDVAIHRSSLLAAAAALRLRPGIVGWDPYAVVEEVHEAGYTVGDGPPYRLERATGTYRENGVPGFAFAVDPRLGVRCDERFSWWGGDDDLVWSFLLAGYGAHVMRGIGVAHWTSTSSAQRPEVTARVDEDRELLLSKWGRAW